MKKKHDKFLYCNNLMRTNYTYIIETAVYLYKHEMQENKYLKCHFTFFLNIKYDFSKR